MFDRDGKTWLNDHHLTKAYIVYTPSIWMGGSTARASVVLRDAIIIL